MRLYFVCLNLNFMQKQRLIKRKYLLIYFSLICSFILVNNNRMYLTLYYMDCKVKKNLVDFNSSSYQLHLLLIFISFAFSLYIASSCCLQTLWCMLSTFFLCFSQCFSFVYKSVIFLFVFCWFFRKVDGVLFNIVLQQFCKGYLLFKLQRWVEFHHSCHCYITLHSTESTSSAESWN